MVSICDCFFTGNDIRIKSVLSAADDLWSQISDIAFATILAEAHVNALGQLFVEIPAALLSLSDQNSVPVVMQITKADYMDGLDLTILGRSDVSSLEMSGVSEWDGSNATGLISKAPGSIGNTYGSPANEDGYLFESQAECNRITGARFAGLTSRFDLLDIEFAGQVLMFDVCPRQFATIDIEADDNPLGFSITGARLVPVGIRFAQTDALKPVITFEIVPVDVRDGVTVIPPVPADSDEPYYPAYTSHPPLLPMSDTWFPPVTFPSLPPSTTCNNSTTNAYGVSWDKSELRGDDEERIARIYFPCKLHQDSGFASFLSMGGGVTGASTGIGSMYGDAAAHVHLYAISGGSRVLLSDSAFMFHPASPLDVDGFELELESGLGDDVVYMPMSVIASGTLQSTDRTGDAISGLISGQYYSFESSGGVWHTPASNPGPSYSLRAHVGDSDLSIPYAVGLLETTIRYFCIATGSEFNIRCGPDTYWQDNGGYLDYIIRNARADGRRIKLGAIYIKNVCPAG
jgi:hypothetical protein